MFIVMGRPQVFYLCKHYDELKEGIWPEGTPGYTDEKVETTRSFKAPFQAVSEVYAEISFRIESCGDAGVGLVREAKELKIDELSPDSLRALNYCTGWRRRSTFKEWIWKRENRGGRELVHPCICGANRWHTIKKDKEWRCRKCGVVRKEGVIPVPELPIILPDEKI